MPTLVIQNNVLDSGDDIVIECDNVMDALIDHFGDAMPDNARLYHNEVNEQADVTPRETSIDEDIEKLLKLEGTIYCVEYPEFFLFGLFGGLFKVLLLGLLVYILRPKPPKPRNAGDDSPNNGLSDRQNQARPNARIPDIYGKVRSTPDLIAVPYKRYEANREVEYAYHCVGRGEFDISDIKDDTTPIEDIAAVSVEVYGPNQSPNKPGKVIQSSVGRAINERVWGSKKSNAVNGQTLRAPDATSIDGNADIGFIGPDQITTSNNDINFETYFGIGDSITIAGSVSNGNTVNLDGTYEIFEVFQKSITLINPGTINANWNGGGFPTPFTDANLNTDSQRWVGPFTVEDPFIILANFIANQGMYKDDGEEQGYIQVEIETEMTPVDNDGNPTGPSQTTTRYIEGHEVLQNARSESSWHGLGLTAAESVGKKWQVRARRVTPKFTETDVRFVDEVQWESLYSIKYVTQQDFGDVTTILTRTPATAGALAVKQRKLNCHAFRKISLRDDNDPSVYVLPKVTNAEGGLIIRDIAIDPLLGGLSDNEIDHANLATTIADIQSYFGTIKTRDFNYTFDDKTTSAEEMIQTVARVLHCNAYRLGDKLSLKFEKETPFATLQFNHRNKIPGSEKRTIQFGTIDDYDGVELDYADPDDGSVLTFRVPTDGSATNPKKLEVPGIQDVVQAHFHAYREFQKIQYRTTAVEFEATAEASILLINDKILVADNTRQDTIDGQIEGINGSRVKLSQPFTMEGGTTYTIFLQHFDGTVESLPVAGQVDEYEIVLGSPPRAPLVLGHEKFATTTYIVVKDGDLRPTEFMVQEKSYNDNMTVEIVATNYDTRFYANDQDYNKGLFEDPQGSRMIFVEDFESFDVPAGTFQAFQNPGGFTSSGPIEIQNNIAGIGPAAQGTNLCELDGTLKIWVDLPTTATKTYELLLWYSPRPNVSAAENRIDVFWNNVFVITLTDEHPTIEWRTIFQNLPNPNTGNTRLEFRSITGTGLGGLLDHIRVREND